MLPETHLRDDLRRKQLAFAERIGCLPDLTVGLILPYLNTLSVVY